MRRTILAFWLLAFAGGTAVAADCPGNPNALGTSRTLVVDPTEHPLLGVHNYRESLPLEDHEVVCPRHGARFCLRTGAALGPPAYEPVATFPVRRSDGRLWLSAD